MLYFCYDLLGTLIAYIGAATALVLIYTIPSIINMINYYIKHQPNEEIERIKKEKEELMIDIDTDEIIPLKPWKAFIFYMCMVFIILIGIINLMLQINPINFFRIKIKKSE